ncbi:uncharacterized protein LOC110031586 isoform X2 [Phalaenopsis equestris]|uniref:uncharacterized protein LOC110031586 isoform X2 n=1 Tax=Phalaenopsis equestris TaxID=78828 RepID=UPI0009E61540|nr:uncharacterized protein LOC110031586 isoform X2 [Phalaenopsis equestris]
MSRSHLLSLRILLFFLHPGLNTNTLFELLTNQNSLSFILYRYTELSCRMKEMLAPLPVPRFQLHWLMRLGMEVGWWMIHLLFRIYQCGTKLWAVFESYIISLGLLESHRNPALHMQNLRHLAVVVDSQEASDNKQVKKLLLWLSNIGVKSVILYDMEGVLKKSLDGDWSSFINGMTIELLSFADNKGGMAKAANFLCSKYQKEELESCEKDFRITDTEISDALDAVGGLPASDVVDLSLIYFLSMDLSDAI